MEKWNQNRLTIRHCVLVKFSICYGNPFIVYSLLLLLSFMHFVKFWCPFQSLNYYLFPRFSSSISTSVVHQIVQNIKMSNYKWEKVIFKLLQTNNIECLQLLTFDREKRNCFNFNNRKLVSFRLCRRKIFTFCILFRLRSSLL